MGGTLGGILGGGGGCGRGGGGGIGGAGGTRLRMLVPATSLRDGESRAREVQSESKMPPFKSVALHA